MAPDFTTERELVALLKTALTPVPVHWGFAPFESSGVPPMLPIVVVQRLSYSTAGYEDMCEGDYVGDTALVVHAWALHYEVGRMLCDQVRAALRDAVGWRLQQETDTYEPNFHAWCIAGQWNAGGVPPL